ncbi:MAG: phosphatase PAP2 family protein [Spirochaetota bacterium]
MENRTASRIDQGHSTDTLAAAGCAVSGHYYDRRRVVFIVLAAWFLCCGNKRLGYRVGFAFLASAVVNPLLKNSFRIERPIGVEGIESQRLHTATGYAFPSGHTQGATAFWTGMMTYVRRRWMYLLGTALIFLVALSRMYLGVHWPSDVIGGVAA